MAQRFRNKPVEVTAIQFVGGNKIECIEFTEKKASAFSEVGMSKKISKQNSNWFLIIPTNQGNIKVRNGDYIIRDANGEFSTRNADSFTETYELIKEQENEQNQDN